MVKRSAQIPHREQSWASAPGTIPHAAPFPKSVPAGCRILHHVTLPRSPHWPGQGSHYSLSVFRPLCQNCTEVPALLSPAARSLYPFGGQKTSGGLGTGSPTVRQANRTVASVPFTKYVVTFVMPSNPYGSPGGYAWLCLFSW